MRGSGFAKTPQLNKELVNAVAAQITESIKADGFGFNAADLAAISKNIKDVGLKISTGEIQTFTFDKAVSVSVETPGADTAFAYVTASASGSGHSSVSVSVSSYSGEDGARSSASVSTMGDNTGGTVIIGTGDWMF